MKILILNPQIDAKHEIVRSLESKNTTVVLATSAADAWRLLQLHGSTVDIAIIHREGPTGDDGGLRLAAQIKADPAQADLPYILTYDRWSETEAAAHQQTPVGANAYLSTPLYVENLFRVIDAVSGSALCVGLETASAPAQFVAESSPMGVRLEETSKVFRKSDDWLTNHHEPSVKLDLPTARTTVATPPAEVQVAVASPAPASPVPIYQDRAYAPAAPVQDPPPAVSLDRTPAPPPSFSTIELDGPTRTLEIPTAMAESVSEPKVETKLEIFAPPPPVSAPEPYLADDSALAEDLPYLFAPTPSPAAGNRLQYTFPVGDSVVPGGAAHAPDLETLKKYLLLREQDVAALSTQLRLARDQIGVLEDQARMERIRTQELSHITEEQKRKLGEFEKEKALELEAVQAEVSELKFQVKTRGDKVRLLEMQVRESLDETGRLKERVKTDIRRIRVREKELENRLEILKKDSEALLAAREGKIVELKRKVDLLEFNMDLLQDQHNREKERSEKLKEQLGRAAQAVKVAGGLLDHSTGAPVASGISATGSDGRRDEKARVA